MFEPLSHMQHALDITAQVMPVYEEMFGVEFPLPKLDTLLASGTDGAMENWVSSILLHLEWREH
jgi:aminopeptidase N